MSKKHITTFYPRDYSVFSALARCGYVTETQLKEFVRDKRLLNYQKDGLVSKCLYSRPGDKKQDVVCYQLTDRGKEICRKLIGIDHIYSAASPKHDLALAERYFSLPKQSRETWRTEGDLRESFSEHISLMKAQGDFLRANELEDMLRNHEISMPDAAYTTESGDEVAFEVITNNYGEAEIQAKEAAAVELGITIEYQKV